MPETKPEAKYEEITLGETICKIIKEVFYKDIPWPSCYRQVADKFTIFKKILREFHNEKDNVKILKQVQHFKEKDVMEVFDLEKETTEKETKKNKYGNDVTWVPVPNDKPELLDKIRQLVNS